jgi:hypothetical protein
MRDLFRNVTKQGCVQVLVHRETLAQHFDADGGEFSIWYPRREHRTNVCWPMTHNDAGQLRTMIPQWGGKREQFNELPTNLVTRRKSRLLCLSRREPLRLALHPQSPLDTRKCCRLVTRCSNRGCWLAIFGIAWVCSRTHWTVTTLIV